MVRPATLIFSTFSATIRTFFLFARLFRSFRILFGSRQLKASQGSDEGSGIFARGSTIVTVPERPNCFETRLETLSPPSPQPRTTMLEVILLWLSEQFSPRHNTLLSDCEPQT